MVRRCERRLEEFPTSARLKAGAQGDTLGVETTCLLELKGMLRRAEALLSMTKNRVVAFREGSGGGALRHAFESLDGLVERLGAQ